MLTQQKMAANQRKRTVLSVDKKLDICKRLKKGATITSLSKELNIGKSTISDIKRNEEKLVTFVEKFDSAEGSTKRKTMKAAKDRKLDEGMAMWFMQKRSEGVPISGPILMAKALEFHAKMYPNGGGGEFKASTGWLKNFQGRYGIRQIAIQGETLSAKADLVQPFKDNLSRIIEEEGLTLNQVYNCDETGLYWKALPSKTLASRTESKAPGYKVSKERVTILACANATGDNKLRLTMVGKSRNPRALKNVSHSVLPVRYTNQTNAWMDMKLFEDWFFQEFIPSVKKYSHERKLEEKALLLLDNAPAHPSTDVLQSEDGTIKCLFLPPNTTSLVQPMDQSVLENMKRRYRKELLKKLLLADDSTTAESEVGVIAFWKSLTIKDAMYMVSDAWNYITDANIRASWNKLLGGDMPATSTDEANPVPEMLQALACLEKNTDYEEADVEEWLQIDASDPGYAILSDDEIVQRVTSPDTFETDDGDYDEPHDVQLIPSHAEACEMFKKCILWAEQQPETTGSHVMTLRSLIGMSAQKRMSNFKQTKITSFFS